MLTRVVGSARQAGNRLLCSQKGLQIWAQDFKLPRPEIPLVPLSHIKKPRPNSVDNSAWWWDGDGEGLPYSLMLKDTPGMLHCCCMGRRRNRQCPPRISRRWKKNGEKSVKIGLNNSVIAAILHIYCISFQGNKCQNVTVFSESFVKKVVPLSLPVLPLVLDQMRINS
jgi:hypothetical protein